ncbi:MAG: hypothetical protein QG620_313 [Patescibacteria group bacterium]|nr:hypothetical protein [Patescibacteria group bacterium]
MRVKCTESLYWHQDPGYDGFLLDEEFFKGKAGLWVFIEGKEYEIVSVPLRETNGLEYITLFAVGEDDRWYRILEDELHRGTTAMAVNHFDFNNPLSGYRSPRREDVERILSNGQACCPDCCQVGEAKEILSDHACPMHIGRG